MSKQFQFAVTLDGNTLSIELPASIAALLNDGLQGSTQIPSAVGRSAAQQEVGQLTERELVAQKNPHGHSEIVAVLALCLRDAGKVEFTSEDIKRAYIRAGVRPPKVIAQALRDAKNKYDFIESGSKRSAFRLSPYGERTVVFDLPRMKQT